MIHHHGRGSPGAEPVVGTPRTRRRLPLRIAESRAASCERAAVAYCQGPPLCNEIEAREASRLMEATALAAEAIAHRCGRETCPSDDRA